MGLVWSKLVLFASWFKGTREEARLGGDLVDTPVAQQEVLAEVEKEIRDEVQEVPVTAKTILFIDLNGHKKLRRKNVAWLTAELQQLEPSECHVWKYRAVDKQEALHWLSKGGPDEYKYERHDRSLGFSAPMNLCNALPKSGLVDVLVYTDGRFTDEQVKEAANRLVEVDRTDLRFRSVTVTLMCMGTPLTPYFNPNLPFMFPDQSVVKTRNVRYKGGTWVDFSVGSSDANVKQLMDAYFGLDKSEEDMTLGRYLVARRCRGLNPAERRAVAAEAWRREVALTAESRISLTSHQERLLLQDLDAGDWTAVQAPFIGHHELLSGRVEQLRRIYRAINIANRCPKKDQEVGWWYPKKEEMLLDRIQSLGLQDDAVVVVPLGLSITGWRTGVRWHPLRFAVDLNVELSIQSVVERFCFQDVFGFNGFFNETVQSSGFSFAVNDYTEHPLMSVFLVPVSAETGAEAFDAWNAFMVSRSVEEGARHVPSMPLAMALLLERGFEAWGEASGEDAVKAARIKDVCRRYLARFQTPLTLTLQQPVVEGTFSTAAKLACGVLAAARDPNLPLGVLTQLWTSMKDVIDGPLMVESVAERVWSALRPYTGVPDDAPFPATEMATIRSLATGMHYRRCARDASLRQKKGRRYSVRMYHLWLQHLAAHGCDRGRLLHEELAARRDLLGVPDTEPLLCLHGFRPEECKPLDGQPHVAVCAATGRPTLLNRNTMDMWYVNNPAIRQSESLHKVMVQLAKKNNKAKLARLTTYPPDEQILSSFVNQRVHSTSLNCYVETGDVTAARWLPTLPCLRLAWNVIQVYESYQQLPNMGHKKLRKMLRQPREVCANGPCCEFIREAVSEQQLAWINSHATLGQLAKLQQDLRQDILSGKLSYRSIA